MSTSTPSSSSRSSAHSGSSASSSSTPVISEQNKNHKENIEKCHFNPQFEKKLLDVFKSLIDKKPEENMTREFCKKYPTFEEYSEFAFNIFGSAQPSGKTAIKFEEFLLCVFISSDKKNFRAEFGDQTLKLDHATEIVLGRRKALMPHITKAQITTLAKAAQFHLAQGRQLSMDKKNSTSGDAAPKLQLAVNKAEEVAKVFSGSFGE